MTKAACFLIAGVIILTGCAVNTTIGDKFDGSMIHKIKTGISTKEHVLSLMGTPFGKNTSSNGTSMWTYSFTAAKTSHPLVAVYGFGGSENSTQILTVTFNKSDVVTACTYRTSSAKGSGYLGAISTQAGGGGEREERNCENVRE